jgi:hypothetical protein
LSLIKIASERTALEAENAVLLEKMREIHVNMERLKALLKRAISKRAL